MTVRSRRGWPARTIALLCASMLWLVLVGTVAAHSELVSSKPAAGASVPSAPGLSVVLSFSEALKNGSKADVAGPGGSVVGTATIDPNDNTKLSWTATAALPPGSYTIRWTSIAMDTDVLRGTIPFTVTEPPASVEPSASPTPAPSTTPTPTAALSPTATPNPTDASPTGAIVLLPVLAALVAIAILGLVLLRNRRPSARR